jgi:hypothetical protein
MHEKKIKQHIFLALFILTAVLFQNAFAGWEDLRASSAENGQTFLPGNRISLSLNLANTNVTDGHAVRITSISLNLPARVSSLYSTTRQVSVMLCPLNDTECRWYHSDAVNSTLFSFPDLNISVNATDGKYAYSFSYSGETQYCRYDYCFQGSYWRTYQAVTGDFYILVRNLTYYQFNYGSASNAVSNAQYEISSAQAAIDSAKQKIVAANYSCSEAEPHFSSALTYIAQASIFLSHAQSNLSVPNASVQHYYFAQTNADQAAERAVQAKGEADAAARFAGVCGTQINNTVAEANASLKAAKKAVDAARGQISFAENAFYSAGCVRYGAWSKLSSAKLLQKDAERFYANASTSYDAKKYAQAKANASSALEFAAGAESAAESAYSLFQKDSAKSQDAGEKVSSAREKTAEAAALADASKLVNASSGNALNLLSLAKKRLQNAENACLEENYSRAESEARDAFSLATEAIELQENALSEKILEIIFGAEKALNELEERIIGLGAQFNATLLNQTILNASTALHASNFTAAAGFARGIPLLLAGAEAEANALASRIEADKKKTEREAAQEKARKEAETRNLLLSFAAIVAIACAALIVFYLRMRKRRF